MAQCIAKRGFFLVPAELTLPFSVLSHETRPQNRRGRRITTLCRRTKALDRFRGCSRCTTPDPLVAVDADSLKQNYAILQTKTLEPFINPDSLVEKAENAADTLNALICEGLFLEAVRLD
jgi:hypothetical protein